MWKKRRRKKCLKETNPTISALTHTHTRARALRMVLLRANIRTFPHHKSAPMHIAVIYEPSRSIQVDRRLSKQ